MATTPQTLTNPTDPTERWAKRNGLRGGAELIPGQSSKAPAFDGQDSGNEFTRNVNNSLNALGGMGVVASVPLRVAQAGQGALRSAMNAAPVLQNAIPRLASPAARAAPDFVAGAGGVAKAGGANLPSVITNTQIPVAKATNVALQEGAKANQMAANARTFGNASAGLGAIDSQQAPLVPGATAGTAPAPDTGNTPASNHFPGVNAQTNARALRLGDPSSPDLNDEFSNAMIENRNPGGKVTKVVGPDGRTSYSGGNVSGEVSFQGADGNALRGRPGGGYAETHDQPGEAEARLAAARATLRNPDGSQWSAGDNAIMAANLRDGVDQYRGTSRQAAQRNDPMNQPMSRGKRTAMVAYENAKMQNAATLRGQDMDLEGKQLTNQSSARRLQYDMAKDERSYKDSRYDKRLEQDSKASDQAGKSLEGLFDTTDEDGKVIRRTDLEAQANLVARRASGGKWGTLSQAERDKHVGSAVSYVSILDSARKHQNNGWMQELGLDNPDAPLGGLPTPEDLSGSKLERVGLREGVTTPNAGKGDYALRLPGNRIMYLGSDLSGEHLKYLQDQGVK